MGLNINGHIPKTNEDVCEAKLSQSTESTASTSTTKDCESTSSSSDLMHSMSNIAKIEFDRQSMGESISSSEMLSEVSDLALEEIDLNLNEKIEAILDLATIEDTFKDEIINFRDEIKPQVMDKEAFKDEKVRLLSKHLKKLDFVLNQNLVALHPDLKSSLLEDYRLIEKDIDELNSIFKKLQTKLDQIDDLISLIYKKNNEDTEDETVKDKIKTVAFKFFRSIFKNRVDVQLSKGSILNPSMMKLFSSQDRTINELNALKDLILKTDSKIDQALLLLDRLKTADVENSHIDHVIKVATELEINQFKLNLHDLLQTELKTIDEEQLKQSIKDSIDSPANAKQDHRDFLHKPINQFVKDFSRQYMVTVADPFTETVKSNELNDVEDAFTIVRDAALGFKNISEQVSIIFQSMCTQGMMFELSCITTGFTVEHLMNHTWVGNIPRVFVAQPQEIHTFINISSFEENIVHVTNMSNVFLHDNGHEKPSIEDVLVGSCELSFDIIFQNGTFYIQHPNIVFS